MSLGSTKIYVDTGGLWVLDAWLREDLRDFRANSRWKEYLALLLTDLCDPSCEAVLLLPHESRCEEGLPFPSLVGPLLSSKLMSGGGVPLVSGHEQAPEDVASVFDELRLHASIPKAAGALRSFFNLHNHERVREGWLRGVPDQDDEWEGVPHWLLEALSEVRPTFGEDLELVARRTGIGGKLQAAQLFSILQRGRSYYDAAAQARGRYITHQARWMALPEDHAATPQSDPETVGAVAACALSTAFLEGYVDRDASIVVDSIESVRSSYDRIDECLAEGAPKDVAREVNDAIAKVVGARLSDATQTKVIAAISVAVAGFWSAPGGAAVGLLLHLVKPRLGGRVVRGLKHLGATRLWLDYGVPLRLPYESCRSCGAPKTQASCQVCKLRSGKEEGADAMGL